MNKFDESRITRGRNALQGGTPQGIADQRSTSIYGRGQRVQQSGVARLVDVVICMDATESMVPFLRAMVCCILYFIDQCMRSSLDVQLGAVIFWDELYGEYPESYPVGTPPEELKAIFERTKARGGGDIPESALPAIDKDLSLPGFRPGAQKVLLLITDAPCHDPEGNITSSDILERLKSEQVLTFCCTPNISPYREFASATRGELFPIQPNMSPDAFKDILDALVHKTKVTMKLRDESRALDEAREAIRKTQVYPR